MLADGDRFCQCARPHARSFVRPRLAAPLLAASSRRERRHAHRGTREDLRQADSDILIESSEFARNGAGEGQTHNMYINRVRSFTLRFSYSHGARVGHLVKSRAYSTSILYNRLTGEDGNPSYEIDVPNGGRVEVMGKQIHQGAAAENSTLVSFGAEGTSNPEQALFLGGEPRQRLEGAWDVGAFEYGQPPAPVVDGGTPPMPAEGCGCTTPGGMASSSLALLLLALGRRR